MVLLEGRRGDDDAASLRPLGVEVFIGSWAKTCARACAEACAEQFDGGKKLK